MLGHWSQFVPHMSTDIRGHYEALHHHAGIYVRMNLVSLNFFCVHMNDGLFARTDVWIWMNEKKACIGVDFISRHR